VKFDLIGTPDGPWTSNKRMAAIFQDGGTKPEVVFRRRFLTSLVRYLARL
jgi:hypothetical protein